MSERVRERQQRDWNLGAILRRPQLAWPICITILLEVLLLISALFRLMTRHAILSRNQADDLHQRASQGNAGRPI